MSRRACVDVPALPLQLLLRRHPEWRERPAAVTSGKASTAREPIVWVNREAVRQGVRPGMAPAAAAACCPDLRIGQVAPSEIEAAVSELAGRLYRWSPIVESAAALRPSLAGFGAVGSFWLRASGLSTLFGPLPDWVGSVRKDLEACGFRSSVAVGFSRFGAFAAARARFGEQVFEDPAEERRAAGEAPLVRFGLSDRTLAGLEKLGIRRLRDLLRLSGKGLGDRYGEEARQLHRLASGEIEVLASCVFQPDPPLERRALFDPPETNGERLLFSVKRLLDEILDELGREGLAVLDLSYEMRREDGRLAAASVLPTAPSLDGVRLLSLLRLRLGAESEAEQRTEEKTGDSSGVTAFVLRARAGLLASEPQDLFEFGEANAGAGGNAIRRDRKQAAEALASIRAKFGEDSLVRIETREAHLPRARFRCRPIAPAEAVVGRPASGAAGASRSRLPAKPRTPAKSRSGRAASGPDQGGPGGLRIVASPATPSDTPPATPSDTPPDAPMESPIEFPSRRRPTLVRRIYDRPLPLPQAVGSFRNGQRNEPETWLLQATERGPVRNFAGPYRISGGWWRRLSGRPLARDYYFVRLQQGEVCWVFFDRERRSWFLEGRIE